MGSVEGHELVGTRLVGERPSDDRIEVRRRPLAIPERWRRQVQVRCVL